MPSSQPPDQTLGVQNLGCQHQSVEGAKALRVIMPGMVQTAGGQADMVAGGESVTAGRWFHRLGLQLSSMGINAARAAGMCKAAAAGRRLKRRRCQQDGPRICPRAL